MSSDTVIKAAKARFETHFGVAPEIVRFAPGRVNLLGEHTDYNGGYVFPVALEIGTAVALHKTDAAGTLEITSDAFPDTDTRALTEKATGSWSDYILGSIASLEAQQPTGAGYRIAVASNLPLGSGLSSSAAILVATLRAVSDLNGIAIPPVELARIARTVENAFVGLPCGVMDQFVVSVGTPKHALFLDTRTLDHRLVDLPKTHRFVVVHSGAAHKLTDDGYPQRVAQCNAACEQLGVPLLSDLSIDDMGRIDALAAPFAQRARHVVTENKRVLDAVDALARDDAHTFGRLMVESHASQQHDYEVSIPEIDALVKGALDHGATGARLTGGGFGGSIVALIEDAKVDDWCKAVEAAFPKACVLAVV